MTDPPVVVPLSLMICSEIASPFRGSAQPDAVVHAENENDDGDDAGWSVPYCRGVV